MKQYLLLSLCIVAVVSCKDEEQVSRQKTENQLRYFIDTVYVPIYHLDSDEMATNIKGTIFIRSISTNDSIMINKASVYDDKNDVIDQVAENVQLFPMNKLEYDIDVPNAASHLLISYKIRNDRKPIIDLITFDTRIEGGIGHVTHGTVLSRKRKNWTLGLSNYGKIKNNKSKN